MRFVIVGLSLYISNILNYKETTWQKAKSKQGSELLGTLNYRKVTGGMFLRCGSRDKQGTRVSLLMSPNGV